MVGKKGQMKIQQTAFMLIAITLLFILVGLFFLSFQLSKMKTNAESLEEKNAYLLIQKLADSPEFSCGSSFGTTKSNCIDLDKVSILVKNLENYENFWQVKNIEIKTLGEEEIICNDNYPNCNNFKLLNEELGGIGISNFVLLCQKKSINGIPKNICKVGRLIVSYE